MYRPKNKADLVSSQYASPIVYNDLSYKLDSEGLVDLFKIPYPSFSIDLTRTRASLKHEFETNYGKIGSKPMIAEMLAWFSFNNIPEPKKKAYANEAETTTAMDYTLSTGNRVAKPARDAVSHTAKVHGRDTEWEEEVLESPPYYVEQGLAANQGNKTMKSMVSNGRMNSEYRATLTGKTRLSSMLNSLGKKRSDSDRIDLLERIVAEQGIQIDQQGIEMVELKAKVEHVEVRLDKLDSKKDKIEAAIKLHSMGKSYAEVGKLVGCSPKTVGNWLHKYG